MQKLKEQRRGTDLADYAATLTAEQIAGVEAGRRSLEFASEQEIDAVYAKYGT